MKQRIRVERQLCTSVYCHSFSFSQQLKIFESQNQPREKNWTPKIPTRKSFGPTKHLREKILDLRNTHEKKFETHETPTKARWHDATRPMRPTMLREPLNLAHSFQKKLNIQNIQRKLSIQRKLDEKNCVDNKIFLEYVHHE